MGGRDSRGRVKQVGHLTGESWKHDTAAAAGIGRKWEPVGGAGANLAAGAAYNTFTSLHLYHVPSKDRVSSSRL